VSFHDVSGGLGVRKFATDGTPGNVGSVGVTVDDDREEFISEHALSGESQCNTAMVAFTRETCVGDCVEYSLSAEAKVFGTPCLPTLTAEPNPLPLSDVGIVSVRANRGAFKVVSATLAKGASDYKIIKDECSGKVIVPNGPVCALHIQVTGSAIPGVLRVLTDADYTLDIKLGSSAVSLALVAPAQGATGVDPANAGFVWTASSNPSGYRVSVCKDAAMTQCETTTSVVRAQK
jgi:hypothetical protein